MLTLRFPSYWSMADCLWVLSRYGLTNHRFDRQDPDVVHVTLPPGTPVPAIPSPVVVETVNR